MAFSSQKLVTMQDLVEFTDKTILPGIEKIVKNSENKILKIVKNSENKVLNSNDKIAKEIIAAR